VDYGGEGEFANSVAPTHVGRGLEKFPLWGVVFAWLPKSLSFTSPPLNSLLLRRLPNRNHMWLSSWARWRPRLIYCG
jgi:hypothetical protein